MRLRAAPAREASRASKTCASSTTPRAPAMTQAAAVFGPIPPRTQNGKLSLWRSAYLPPLLHEHEGSIRTDAASRLMALQDDPRDPDFDAIPHRRWSLPAALRWRHRGIVGSRRRARRIRAGEDDLCRSRRQRQKCREDGLIIGSNQRTVVATAELAQTRCGLRNAVGSSSVLQVKNTHRAGTAGGDRYGRVELAGGCEDDQVVRLHQSPRRNGPPCPCEYFFPPVRTSCCPQLPGAAARFHQSRCVSLAI